MIFTKIEDFQAYQKASDYWDAVNALLERPAFGSHRHLRDQIRNAIDSITANLAEGFEQPTDRAFARYVYIAKGSTAESRKRLRQAQRRRLITEDEYQACDAQADTVGGLLAGLAKYLITSNRRDRGIGAIRSPKPEVRSPKRSPTTGN